MFSTGVFGAFLEMLENLELGAIARRFCCDDLEGDISVELLISTEPDCCKSSETELVDNSVSSIMHDVSDLNGMVAADPILFEVFHIVEAAKIVLLRRRSGGRVATSEKARMRNRSNSIWLFSVPS